MSRLLSELLEAQEPLFSLALRQLEQASGRQSIDVRLSADIASLVRRKTKDLNLDPTDSTAEELYHALIGRLQSDEEQLLSAMGISSMTTPSQLTETLIGRLGSLSAPRNAWVIKKSVAKELLKKTPPKKLMAALGYRSLASMLKNEPTLKLCAALRFTEDAKWLSSFIQQYKSLSPSDFETRPIEVFQIPENCWSQAATDQVTQKGHSLTNLKELGVIGILAPKAISSGWATAGLLLVLHYYNEIRTYSAFFKLQQVKPGFGQSIIKSFNDDAEGLATMAGQSVSWRVIHHHFGSLEAEHHPEFFEPHVQPEDLHWDKSELTLSAIDPLFQWWQGLEYSGVSSSASPVSLNMLDVALSSSNRQPFSERQVGFMQSALWNEIFSRYMGQKILADQVLKQLDSTMLVPQTIAQSLKGKRV